MLQNGSVRPLTGSTTARTGRERRAKRRDSVVGNEHVRLSPPGMIGYGIGVREGSSVLRGSRGTISIKLDRKPE